MPSARQKYKLISLSQLILAAAIGINGTGFETGGLMRHKTHRSHHPVLPDSIS